MGKTPIWVMRSFTYPQLGMMYAKIKEIEFDGSETLARLVWAVASGWKKQAPLKDEAAVSALNKLGMVVEV